MTFWHKHEFIYKRDEAGQMRVECLSCPKKFDLPWKSEQVPTPTAFELERLMRK